MAEPPPPAAAQRFDPDRARAAIRRGVLSIVLSVLIVGATLAALVSSDLPIGAEALSTLRAVRPGPLALSWLIISGAFCFLGLRWRALMPPPHRPPGLGLSAIICAGLLLNYAVPGPFGEIGAAWFASRRYKVPMADALASGVGARLLGLASAAVMSLLVWLVLDLPPPTTEAALLHRVHALVPLAAVSIGAGGLLLFWLAIRPRWWRDLVHRILQLAPAGGRLERAAGRVDGAVGELAAALERVAGQGPRPYVRAVGWSVAAHLCVIAGIQIACWGMGVEAELSGLVFTYTATTAGAVVLFAAPGSQVGWDLMFASLLVAAAGMPVAAAGAVAVIVRLQQLSMMLLGAAALAWLLQETRTA